MARHNIQFKGLRHTPSDITGQDGDLLECVNLIHENGELKPIEMPERTALQTGSGHSLVAVHNVSGDKIFVSMKVDGGDTILAAFRESGSSQAAVNIGGSGTKTISGEAFQWADTIGNTLIVGTDKSIHYALYMNGEYKWLGDKLPQPVFKFDFKRSLCTDAGYYISEYEPNTYAMTSSGATVGGGGIPMHGSGNTVVGDYPGPSDDSFEINLSNKTEENKRTVRDGFRTKIEKALSRARMNNVFVFPFFIRYAVRMYDGSYVMHSAPLLMIPSSLECPLLGLLRLKKDGNGDLVLDQDGDVSAPLYSIAFDSVSFRGMELSMSFEGWRDEAGSSVSASDWADILKGVDIFMSSQIRSYDEREWDDLSKLPDRFYHFNVKDGGGNYTNREYGHCYTKNNKIAWWNIFDKTTNPSNGVFDPDSTAEVQLGGGVSYSAYDYYKIPIPSVSHNEIKRKIEETDLFYRVKKYDMFEVQETWTRDFRNEVELGTLDKLETMPTLPDDYVSRSKMAGKANYNYNQRLLIGNLQLQVPLWYQDANTYTDANVTLFTIMFKIDKPEKTIYVPWTKSNLGRNDFGHYLYYPDVDCKEAIISNGVTVRVIPMDAHTGLNGAYALMPDLDSLYEAFSSFPEFEGELPSASENRYYSLENTVAMSSVANPFYFSSRNFKDIGRTKVIGIASNTLDVSYSQWGPYPVIVFCNDGIVTVPIDKNGDFAGGAEAISADVLREPQGYSQPTLVQTGQVLMFLTQRGVMMIAGTKISCVSEAMNGKHFDPLTELSPANSVLYGVGAFSSLVSKTSDTTDFMTFAATGFLAYDYAHNRLLLLNNSKDYQYVFSMNTGLWSKQISYTNLSDIQVPATPGGNERSVHALSVVPMTAAVNNYTEMYLQDTSGNLYKTMEVTNENVSGSLYQYGYFISRPVRFGTDEYKTITRMLNRYTHYAANSFARVALYGSRDGKNYGRINTLRGMGYQYYIFVVYAYLKPNERYSYMSVDFEPRLTNKLR